MFHQRLAKNMHDTVVRLRVMKQCYINDRWVRENARRRVVHE